MLPFADPPTREVEVHESQSKGRHAADRKVHLRSPTPRPHLKAPPEDPGRSPHTPGRGHAWPSRAVRDPRPIQTPIQTPIQLRIRRSIKLLGRLPVGAAIATRMAKAISVSENHADGRLPDFIPSMSLGIPVRAAEPLNAGQRTASRAWTGRWIQNPSGPRGGTGLWNSARPKAALDS